MEQQMACTPDVFPACAAKQMPDVDRIVAGPAAKNTPASSSGPCRAGV